MYFALRSANFGRLGGEFGKKGAVLGKKESPNFDTVKQSRFGRQPKLKMSFTEIRGSSTWTFLREWRWGHLHMNLERHGSHSLQGQSEYSAAILKLTI
jgi:hypothetical protein